MRTRTVGVLALCVAASGARIVEAQRAPDIRQVTLGETNQPTPEITTEEMEVERDRTAVWVDARSGPERNQGSIRGAVHITKGEAEQANDDGRLPKKDKGTRVVVFADTPAEARAVAQEIAHKAYWNSSYFSGKPQDLFTLSKR